MNILRLNDTLVPYTINKAFANNMCISVQGNEIVVNAPWYVGKKYIQEVISEKKQWILNKIKSSDNIETINKGTVVLLGNNYSLVIKYKNISSPVINIDSKSINVVLPYKYKKIDSEYISKMLISKIYDRVASEEIERAMEKTRLLLGMAPEDYSICDNKDSNIAMFVQENKKIIFNSNICYYSRDVIDYIVLHEFCHIRYKIHCKNFWKLIRTYCPNHKKYEELLKEKKY